MAALGENNMGWVGEPYLSRKTNILDSALRELLAYLRRYSYVEKDKRKNRTVWRTTSKALQKFRQDLELLALSKSA